MRVQVHASANRSVTEVKVASGKCKSEGESGSEGAAASKAADKLGRKFWQHQAPTASKCTQRKKHHLQRFLPRARAKARARF